MQVESRTKADQMWYFPMLVPYNPLEEFPDPAGDHIPVRADLADLGRIIEWCKTHDAECKQIAANAEKMFHRFMSRDGILDYVQYLCHGVAKRFHPTGGLPPQANSCVAAGVTSTRKLLPGSLEATELRAKAVNGKAVTDKSVVAATDQHVVYSREALFTPGLTKWGQRDCDWFHAGHSDVHNTGLPVGVVFRTRPNLPALVHSRYSGPETVVCGLGPRKYTFKPQMQS